jgi:serine/threonine-protein kinase
MAGGEGSTFGKYFLLKQLALGGMGEIFLARLEGPVGFEKLLVVKRILQHRVENQEFIDMFFAEARIAAKLSHSNIVQIYEMGEIEGSYYIAMEYVHGKSLRELIDMARARGEHVPPSLVIDITSELASGLSYAHNATHISGERIGVVHRDVNPHNLLISYSGEVKIIDFGIAKSEMSMHKTETGTIKGKVAYMSPEQSTAEQLDKRSDIFSVGICLYEALTLFNPFAKANVASSIDAVRRQDLPPVSQTSRKLAAFDPIVGKALAKKREDRYQDCIELRDALQGIQLGGEIERSRLTLEEYMQDMFEEQIEGERRMILETSSARTQQLELTTGQLDREHDSGSHPRQGLQQNDSGRVTTYVSAADGPQLPHSRAPFFLILAAILVVSGAAATAAYQIAVRQRIATAYAARRAVDAEPVPSNERGRPVVAEAPLPRERPVTETETALAAADETDRGETDAGETGRGETDAGEAGTERRGEAADGAGSTPRRRKTADRKRKRGKSGGRSSDPGAPEPRPLVTPKPADPPSASRQPPRSFGTMFVSTSPPVKIFRGSTAVGQTIKLKRANGKLVFGTGTDPKADPFVVRIRYAIDGDQITYAVEAEPWAIVRDRNGIGLGRPPLPTQGAAAGKTVFELVNPQQGLRLRITLRYSR